MKRSAFDAHGWAKPRTLYRAEPLPGAANLSVTSGQHMWGSWGETDHLLIKSLNKYIHTCLFVCILEPSHFKKGQHHGKHFSFCQSSSQKSINISIGRRLLSCFTVSLSKQYPWWQMTYELNYVYFYLPILRSIIFLLLKMKILFVWIWQESLTFFPSDFLLLNVLFSSVVNLTLICELKLGMESITLCI